MKKFALSIALILSSLTFAEKDIELLIAPETISQKIQEVAARIDEEYKDQELVIVTVLKGGICVTADLMRNLHIPLNLQCIKASSYGKRGAIQGDLHIKGFKDLDVEGKHVLLVDDIFDSGKTMTALVAKLQEKNPKSIKTLVVLMKKNPRQTSYLPDYVLFEIENRFVVGYGLDYKEYFRELPGIYAFIDDKPPAFLANSN